MGTSNKAGKDGGVRKENIRGGEKVQEKTETLITNPGSGSHPNPTAC